MVVDLVVPAARGGGLAKCKPHKSRLSRRCGVELTRGSCRRLPRGSSWSGCSGRGTRCAPPEGACETSAPSAPTTASRRWRRRGRARGCRRCSLRLLALVFHGGCGGYAAVVCVSPSPFLPLARLLPAARWVSCLPFPGMLGPPPLLPLPFPTACLLPQRTLKLRFAATQLAQLGDDGCDQGSQGDVILDGDLLPEFCTGMVSV